jgi:tRNA threonylcarbamoyladenosine biosynthesis protein TsaB
VTSIVQPRLLLLETSSRVGQVALARGDLLVGLRRLDEARRHARDLVPGVQELLAGQGWSAQDLEGVIVSRGPGSYTGLRVGIISAKALAYATGCALLAVDTFAVIAAQSPPDVLAVEVLADAQQGKVYVERFERPYAGAPFLSRVPLAVRPLAEWLVQPAPPAWVSGPGLRGHEGLLPPRVRPVPADRWDAQAEGLLRLGLARYLRGERDDLWTLEPLYLRPSSAEQQWEERKTGP